MTLLRSLVATLTVATVFAAGQVAADTISISGAVLRPGAYQWHQDARLHDAAVAGQVRADAWFLGAALLRQSAIEPQQRLKAGVLFDLRVNRLHARAENDLPLVALLEQLTDLVESLPVTGRQPAELNPLQLMIPHKNALLEPGDQLIYPLRSDQVRVMGAVIEPCSLAFDSTLKLKHYLRQCPRDRVADRDEVYIIQPDGHVQKVGIAHWNAHPSSLAVGAIIYRPLSGTALSPDTPEFNQDMAALLATQYQLGGRFSE